MISPRQFAEKHGKAYTTVMHWFQNELVEGQKKLTLPDGRFVYEVPENAPVPNLSSGRPKKAETKPGAQKAAKKPAKKTGN